MSEENKIGESRKVRFSHFSKLFGIPPPPRTPQGFWEFASDARRKTKIVAWGMLIATASLLISVSTYPWAALAAPPAVIFGYGALVIVSSWLSLATIRRSMRRFSDHLIERKFMVCFGCGYDLRNLPSDRCPECGNGYDHEKLRSLWQDWLNRNKIGKSS